MGWQDLFSFTERFCPRCLYRPWRPLTAALITGFVTAVGIGPATRTGSPLALMRPAWRITPRRMVMANAAVGGAGVVFHRRARSVPPRSESSRPGGSGVVGDYRLLTEGLSDRSEAIKSHFIRKPFAAVVSVGVIPRSRRDQAWWAGDAGRASRVFWVLAWARASCCPLSTPIGFLALCTETTRC